MHGPRMFFIALAAALVAAPAFAAQPARASPQRAAPAVVEPTAAVPYKACDALKTEIAADLDAKGVTSYTLRIVTPEEAAAASGEKVVGSCDGGTHRILYKRG